MSADRSENASTSHRPVLDAVTGKPRLPWVEIQEWTIFTLVGPKKIVTGRKTQQPAAFELISHWKPRQGDFVRVRHIFHNPATDKIILRGHRFRRNTRNEGMLDFTLNEVYLDLCSQSDADSDIWSHGMQDFSPEQILAKRTLIVTNKPLNKGIGRHIDHSFRDHTIYASDAPNAKSVKKSIHDSSELVCRYAFVHKSTPHTEKILRRIREDEADLGYSMPDVDLFRIHRGSLPIPGQVYSVGDMFCGIGGVSQGALLAGLIVLLGVEHSEHATKAYLHNMSSNTHVVQADVDQFIALMDHYNIDILHLSPPCQPFSPAHTQPGRNDEANQACLFALGALIDKIHPRIVTLEQTFGIVRQSAHREWFRAVVNILTSRNYSVRWNVLDMSHYGLPQARKRLFIVASCPGSRVPPLPVPTHGLQRGQSPFKTIKDALRSLDHFPGISEHNPRTMKRISKPPYPITLMLRACMTTCGARKLNYHPSGLRHFTIREFLCLQGFPPTFNFPDGLSDVVKRHGIGNAVPPSVARQIFETIQTQLRREDERFHQHRWTQVQTLAERRGVEQRLRDHEVIVIE